MVNKLRNSIKKSGFTLVELLATIVILAVILVIAVPKVMNIINDTKKSTFAASVKLIASGAEKRYAEDKALGNTDEITCKDVAKLSSNDYKLCEIVFEKDEARVTVIGDGKFEGLSVVYASKTNAEVQTGTPERLYTFDDLYSLIDELKNEVNTYKERIEDLENNNDGNSDAIENLENRINEHDNKINSNTTSISNLTNKDSSSNVFLKNYPVGSIYVSTTDVNPSTKFGGTWVSFGAGRTLVGVDTSQTEFASVGKTGGEKTHTLTIDEMPSHKHGWLGYLSFGTVSSGEKMITIFGNDSAQAEINKGKGPQAAGGSQPHNNLQPYITVYMWKRTA